METPKGDRPQARCARAFYHRAMRRTVALALAAAAIAASCSSGSDGEAATTAAPTVATDPPATDPPPTDPPVETTTSTTTSTIAPTTTIEDAAILAEVEAAYFDAYKIGIEAIRDPTNPINDERFKTRYTDANLDFVRQNLQQTLDGNFVAVENEAIPSFAIVVKPAAFIETDDRSVAELEVCEFNSDRILRTAPGSDETQELVRDDPISIILRIRFELVDGVWKSASGSVGEEVRSEEEQCSRVS